MSAPTDGLQTLLTSFPEDQLRALLAEHTVPREEPVRRPRERPIMAPPRGGATVIRAARVRLV